MAESAKTSMPMNPPGTDPNPDAPKGMSVKGNQVNVDDPQQVVTPPEGTDNLILGKFKTQDDLATAYTELEKKLGTAPAPEGGPAPKGDAPAPKTAEGGLNLAEIGIESLNNDGKLTDATYERLAKAGIDRGAADQLVEGQKAVAAQVRAGLAELAGGEEGLKQVLEWAGDNLDDSLKDAFNRSLQANDPAAAKLALQGVIAQYVETNGVEPSLLAGGETAPDFGAFPPFESNEQMVEAMADKRYKEDPAYRAKVAKRIENGLRRGTF